MPACSRSGGSPSLVSGLFGWLASVQVQDLDRFVGGCRSAGCPGSRRPRRSISTPDVPGGMVGGFVADADATSSTKLGRLPCSAMTQALPRWSVSGPTSKAISRSGAQLLDARRGPPRWASLASRGRAPPSEQSTPRVVGAQLHYGSGLPFPTGTDPGVKLPM